ncbi:hypothetical protein JXJ21_16375 [candidate division KSB1 bacterium]|nr:hypothetical protein [candidate division KSB1 bacterium]
MKFKFLEKFEENFYFRTSHIFWHVLMAIAGLGLVVGVLIFLWGLTPSFKPGVDEPEFPEPISVTAREIMLKLSPESQLAATTTVPAAGVTIPQVQADTLVAKEIDPDEQAYLVSLDSMKVLLPENQFAWNSRGHWQRGWYRREWVTDVWGIEDRLKSAFKQSNADDFSAKKQLLDGYISLIEPFPVSQRMIALKSAIEFPGENVTASVENIRLLINAIPNFSSEDAGFVTTLATFGRKNPRDGRSFIEYANLILPKFLLENRITALNSLIIHYYRNFNNIEKQREATDLFLDLIPEIPGDNQVAALGEYYTLFREKNTQREERIAMLNAEYESEKSKAESVLHEKKHSKSNFRSIGWRVIGSSIVFISFVAMFLVLLSIQRNVKLLREGTANH